jgi:hypothetical protein
MTWKAKKYNQPFRNIPEKIIQYITTIMTAINTYTESKFEDALLPETTSLCLNMYYKYTPLPPRKRKELHAF